MARRISPIAGDPAGSNAYVFARNKDGAIYHSAAWARTRPLFAAYRNCAMVLTAFEHGLVCAPRIPR